ncbi:MAG: type II secretion system protein GspD [archaeon]
MKVIILAFLLMCPLMNSFPQVELGKKLSGQYNPNELVTISKDASFDDAITTLNSVSQFNTGKSILSTISIKEPIGIDIERVPYLKALDMLINLKGLVYEEGESRILVMRKNAGNENGGQEETKIDYNTFADTDAREINISAVFFDADVARSRERGIDWKAVLSYKEITAGTQLLTKSIPAEMAGQRAAVPPKYELTGSTHFSRDNVTGDITALFRFFEEQDLGEIIASPSITVRDRQKGRIQVGSDFSIKQRDFSGNIIDKFYSAGSIIEVVPYIYQKGEIVYALLKINVERSSFYPSELTTEVKKTSAASDVLLLNGEETVIGGLYVNEESIVRTGIPFLKDLPWWVLGIRYLTGSDQTVVRKKEVVILIKAEVIPTLEERFADRINRDTNKIKTKIQQDESNYNKYRQNYNKDDK